MNVDEVQLLLTLLGGKVSHHTHKWVTCSCIFAPWRHEGGVDKNPSGAMSITNKTPTQYNCFSCDSHGSPDLMYREIKLLNELRPKIKLDKKSILKILWGESSSLEMGFQLPDYETEINKGPPDLYPFSENWWEGFPSAQNHPYMERRGIDPKVAHELEVKLDFIRHRVLFPVRDWSGVLMGAHGRAFLDDVEPKHYAYPRDGDFQGERNPSIWMGEHHVDLEKPVILVEGQFDYAKVYPFYKNVLAGLTTQMSIEKLKRIKSASEIITIFDHGVGGGKGRKRINKFFKKVPHQHELVPKKYGDLGACPDDVVYNLLRNIS